MINLRLLCILGLLAGPFIGVMNYLETAEKKKIDREGIAVTAIPLQKMEQSGRKGSKSYKLEVEFPGQNGRMLTSEVKVSRELYEGIDANPVLQIKYLKEDPDKLMVVGQPIESTEMYLFGAGAFLVGMTGCWWYFIRK